MQAFDVLIIGSGLAGQALALQLAPHKKVALVTKRLLEDSASSRAQGGIAAALDDADSIEAHIRDTLVAGAGMHRPIPQRRARLQRSMGSRPPHVRLAGP